MSLVELLAGIAIGSVVVVGAVFVYSQSRTTFAVNETVARLQEEARFAMSVIEPDVQLAGYFGFTNAADDVSLAPGAIATADMQQTAPARPEVVAAVHACGGNFALDLVMGVQGSNGVFQLGPAATVACDPQGSGAQANTDTLTIRRVSSDDVAVNPARLQVYASRLGRTAHRIFQAAVAPGPLVPNLTVVRNLVVRAYYVAQDSDGRPGFPALRVKALDTDGANPAWRDFEVMPGVEDLQVQFGIDTGDYDNDGAIDFDIGNDGIPEANGIATRYVNPDDPILQPPPVGSSAQVVAVRLWLRVRAEQPEQGFVDNRNYQYADVNFVPAGDAAGFRRVLVSRTIQLRNARTL